MRLPIYITLCVIALASCRPAEPAPLSHIADPQVRHILHCALEAAGGLDDFGQLDTLAYTKRSILLDSNGHVLSDQTEFHLLTFTPPSLTSIRWVHGGDAYHLDVAGESVSYTVNGTPPLAADTAALLRKVASARYTALMPFLLADETARLTYEGLDTLPDGSICHAVSAAYSEGEPWVYFFEKNDCRYHAAWVDHGGYGALVVNDSSDVIGGLRWNLRRTTWRTGADKRPLWKRAQFFYTNFTVRKKGGIQRRGGGTR